MNEYYRERAIRFAELIIEIDDANIYTIKNELASILHERERKEVEIFLEKEKSNVSI